MNTDETRMNLLAHEALTQEIIGASFEVHNTLGYGFLERVYQKALQAELAARGIEAEIEHPIGVRYKGIAVGEYFADLLVNKTVIVELKIASEYNAKDEPQLLNELGLRERVWVEFSMKSSASLVASGKIRSAPVAGNGRIS
ncbi:GxxExxY protein, partial [Ferrigenium sp. UT5]|uniref:GxxExxY protein n=1 Tax=Ferrigenium sp. UT5 TaxID=3242105 RepID=UPI0038B26EE8